ncbi:hypothetical protein COR50_04065 [Chitinophaga caeni]|uniref:Peptidase M15C domain-containing protein n=1 Tax=Chitinophaga caeni TaxID=2029983 RepID=A0A291QR71_9BACT|nr:M15 family metallopeptidase [Chitinophaga caeni]ATL46415.1 hypothetical protein COR50_04065 [Chitinophaga caeni]
MTYDRDPKYLHPHIRLHLDSILSAIQNKLPAGHTAKVVSAYRTPEDQFIIYKKGRTFQGGKWVKTGAVYTNIDGYTRLSRHNYLPCLAIDIGLFEGNTYLGNSNLYKYVKQGTQFQMDWGGNWNSFKDLPHLEVPGNILKPSIEKNIALIWQKYLLIDGYYTAALDGIFGPKSIAALEAATGINARNKAAWDKLFAKYGPPENL